MGAAFEVEKKPDLSYFSPNDILPAEENQLLYDSFRPAADDDDYKLIMSIKEHGIMEPLHVSADGILLSGHRRLAAAQCLGLREVPCIVIENIAFGDLCEDERLKVLSRYNSQRDKSYGERLREALLEVDPDEAYERLLDERRKHGDQPIEDNVDIGECKRRARITTRGFFEAAKNAVYSEREYWPLTVRRVHYLLLNDPPLRHDKKPDSTYQNNESCYSALTNLLARARLKGFIPWAAIDDETRPIRVLATYQHPADFITSETEDYLKYYARDLLRGQPNHIEILVEKNAIRKHVEVVADEYTIPCTTGRGFSSLSPRYKLVQRFRRSGKQRLVLLILSDFDPDGEEIAASFARSLRDDFGLLNVIAHKVALSGDDVRNYNLPSDLKAKVSSPNYKKFVLKHGVNVAELDAAPVELIQSKLRDAIESSLDMDLFGAEQQKEKDDYAFIEATKKLVMRAISDNKLRGEY